MTEAAVSISSSRVARRPIHVPSGVEVKVTEHDISIKGPKGKIAMKLHPSIQIHMDANSNLSIIATNKGYSRANSGSKLKKSIPGTTRANISNMVEGVTKGFEEKLLLVGVGYRAQMKDSKTLNLTLGFSHPVTVDAPEGITIETPTQTEILVKGVDVQLVGYVAAKIRAFRRPEPYKGKGVRYARETVVRKETKKK